MTDHSTTEIAFEDSNRTAEDVFEILVMEHGPMLVTYLRSLVWKAEVVDDLFQETMVVAWRRLDDFDRSRPFGPWLRGIASRLVMAQRRKYARDLLRCDTELLEVLERKFERLDEQEGDGFRQKIRRLRACMKMLPENMREVIELAYGRGLLLREIATTLDGSIEAIKKRIQRARTHLALCIQNLPESGEGS